MVHLITGYAGKEHIQSADARSFNMAMFGDGEFVMEIGEQIDASIISNSTVRVFDGDILMQGGHIRIETDTYEDLTIQTGSAGKNRNDLIVMTYEKNSTDGVETAYLEVIKGTETSGTASDPSYVSGNIAAGDTKNQMPLYRAKVEGVVLSELEPLFTTIPTYKTLSEQYAEQFEEACETHLDSLNILDSKEEIEANTQENQLAGALGVKEGLSALNENIAEKAPTSHASASTTYGVGTTTNYGHCMTINNLTTTAHADGKALSAYQGKLLKNFVDKKVVDKNMSVLNLMLLQETMTVSNGTFSFDTSSIATSNGITFKNIVSISRSAATSNCIVTSISFKNNTISGQVLKVSDGSAFSGSMTLAMLITFV